VQSARHALRGLGLILVGLLDARLFENPNVIKNLPHSATNYRIKIMGLAHL
jgi:hypothetical protein